VKCLGQQILHRSTRIKLAMKKIIELADFEKLSMLIRKFIE
jgi:hypothetical protein